MKICIECKQEQPLFNFSFKNKQRGTYQSRCKQCYNTYNRKYYREGERTNQINRAKENSKKLKQKITEWKESRGCCICGENAPECLDFHHTDPLLKEGHVGMLGSWKKILEEIDKCLIVCSNCHRKIHSGRIKEPR